MPQPLSPVLDQLRADILDAHLLVRAVAAGRRRGARPEFRRAELRWVDLRDGRKLQVVTYSEQQAFTRVVLGAAAAAAVDELLAQPYGNWHVETVRGTRQVRVTKSGAAQVHRDDVARAADRGHDRTKHRLLDPADPVLRAVGISDRTGRIKPTRLDKYHQVEEFVRALDPVVAAAQQAAAGRPVRVADLGCGNAYLSFAAYRWLERQGVGASLVGVDVKAQARDRNTKIADGLGWADGMRFVAGTIDAAVVEPAPHLVLALHACDTATDDALARAVEWEAPVVLAAPCCHHDIQRQLGGVTPAPYGPLTRHGILRERFADVLTDALRAAILRLMGYRVEVLEFVASTHTPRNTLLRAVRTGAPADPAHIREYRGLVGSWGVRPALAVRLGDRLDDVLDRANG
ncbi:MAG TPA: SAM-dependent methyltransferase [Jiangellales bacterium]|nr:SAM-dependent methyltransferase [Jiangellales bacterium]